jgi:hypothetical protein
VTTVSRVPVRFGSAEQRWLFSQIVLGRILFKSEH